MLTQQQIESLADKVNAEVNIPILGERGERAVLIKAIKKIDKVLDQELPDELKGYINDVTAGIADSEGIDEIKADTVVFLNKQINLPIVGERGEAKIFTIVVDKLFEALKIDKNLDSALAE